MIFAAFKVRCQLTAVAFYPACLTSDVVKERAHVSRDWGVDVSFR